MNSSISLIISTYNWPEALELCLTSVLHQSILPDEIIIADDGSDDRTLRVIQSFQSHLSIPISHVWQEDEGFRKSMILNEAIQSAKADYIIQIDGDVVLDPYFIQDHWNVAEEGTFIRGTRAQITEERMEEVFESKDIDFNFLSRGVFNRFNAIRFPLLAFLMIKKENNSRSVRGSNLAFWKRDFIMVNGYNNELQGWGHEDEELAARFINNGVIKKKVKFKAIQYHLFHDKATRSSRIVHVYELKRVRDMKIRICRNGYHQNRMMKNHLQKELVAI